MSVEETLEFLPIAQRLRAQQEQQLGIEHVYYFYNEDTKHHFHLWMVPRYRWMDQFGKSIAAVRPALIHARDSMNSARDVEVVEEAVEKLRRGMSGS